MPRFEVAKLQVPDASRDPNTIGSKARKNQITSLARGDHREFEEEWHGVH